MHSLLIKNFKKYIVLSLEEEEIIKASYRSVKVPKKTFLLEEGNICDFEAYVISGCFRIYFLGENGQEYTVYFAIEDWWLVDLDSYNNDISTNLYIEALEDSEILLISKERKEALYGEIAEFEKLFRIMTQKNCVALQRRIVNSLSLSAEERYIDFCKRYPQMRARLYNLQIASYLGISPEFLSKIRKKIVL